MTRFLVSLLRATLAILLTITIATVFVIALTVEAMVDAVSDRTGRGQRTWGAGARRNPVYRPVIDTGISLSRRPDGSIPP
jgi:hypothetical protein